MYPVTRIENKFIFLFQSRNPFGENPVIKVISYALYYKDGDMYYNLGFGDLDPESHEVSDTTVSNNGDMRKILATVVSTLKTFFKEKPHETVLINGSDRIRRAYYHKLIVDYWNLIEELYLIKGRASGKIERFQKGKNYEFILISQRAPVSLFEENVYVMTTPKKPLSLQEKKAIEFLSNKKAEDIFPEQNKKAWENLRKAGLIK